MPNSLISRALKKYRSDGLYVTLKLSSRYIFNTAKNIPVVHYISPLEYLVEPSVNDIDETKLYDAQFWLDRYLELKNYYGTSDKKALELYIKHGFPNSGLFDMEKNTNLKYFGGERYSPEPNELLEGYRKRHFGANHRFMLGYHNYDISEKYLDLIDDDTDLCEISVLDYGCGVADPALYLGVKGADITIVDLDTKVLDFAIWRLSERGISHNAVRAKQTESPVSIEDEFDFIIMSEFLEHVRDPEKFLNLAIDKLRTGGIFYDPVGRNYTHTVHGDHLKEAKEVVESDRYKKLHRDNFNRIEEKSHFYRKA